MMKIVKLLIIFSVLILRSNFGSAETKISKKYGGESSSGYAGKLRYNDYITAFKLGKSVKSKKRQQANSVMNALSDSGIKTEVTPNLDNTYDDDQKDDHKMSKFDGKQTIEEKTDHALNAFLDNNSKTENNQNLHHVRNRKTRKRDSSLNSKVFDSTIKKIDHKPNKNNKVDLKSASQEKDKTDDDKIKQSPSLSHTDMFKKFELFFKPEQGPGSKQKDSKFRIFTKVDRTDFGQIEGEFFAPIMSDRSNPEENYPESELIINLATKLHNDLRKLHNSPPLTYNNTIAQMSQAHADKLAIRGIPTGTKHHNLENIKKGFGENIAYFWTLKLNCKQAVELAINAWYNQEIDNYDFEKLKHRGTVGIDIVNFIFFYIDDECLGGYLKVKSGEYLFANSKYLFWGNSSFDIVLFLMFLFSSFEPIIS